MSGRVDVPGILLAVGRRDRPFEEAVSRDQAPLRLQSPRPSWTIVPKLPAQQAKKSTASCAVKIRNNPLCLIAQVAARSHRPPSLEETLNPRPYMSRRTVAIAKCDMTPKLDSLALLLFIPLRIEGLLSLRGP